MAEPGLFVFMGCIACISTALVIWGHTMLPREEWQILAAVPRHKGPEGVWRGTNFTFYGFFTALAAAFSLTLMIILFGSLSVPLYATIVLVTTLLLICVPAAGLIARLVEKKRNTLTVGGASFLGFLCCPWLVMLFNHLFAGSAGLRLDPVKTLAALCISYALGEGIGRMACISFGCCYGKPVEGLPSCLRRPFRRFHIVFTGKTKKIAYSENLDGVPVFPVQTITSAVFVSASLAGTYFFFGGRYGLAFFIPLAGTQVWRSISEFFRADYRGDCRISPYQYMAILALVYSLLVLLVFPPARQSPMPDLRLGMATLWTPASLIFIQAAWLALFFFTGRSSVTASTIAFHVLGDKI